MSNNLSGISLSPEGENIQAPTQEAQVNTPPVQQVATPGYDYNQQQAFRSSLFNFIFPIPLI